MFIRKSFLFFIIGVCLLTVALFAHAAETINVARNQPATQSTMAYGGLPQRAVDGNTDGNYHAGSVTHTSNAPNEWWQVDLLQAHQIRSIRIWNRTDCCGQRLSKFYVFVSNTPFTSGNLEQTKLQPGVWKTYHDGAAGRPTVIDVNQSGRYVRIQLAGREYLSLSEVEVMVPSYRWETYTGTVPASAFIGGQDKGKPLPICRARYTADDNTLRPGWVVDGKCSLIQVNSGITFGNFEVLTTPLMEGPNLAVGKRATQSSTIYNGLAGRAVDGNMNGNWYDSSVTHTNKTPQPWWQVDLGGTSQISSIRIWNRTDCCGQRLSKFYVFVSNTPFTSGNLEKTKLQPGVWKTYYDGAAGRPTVIAVNQSGRYVRIQLALKNLEHLSLAEVQVMASGSSLLRWGVGESVMGGFLTRHLEICRRVDYTTAYIGSLYVWEGKTGCFALDASGKVTTSYSPYSCCLATE